jgi:hypothetical protein
MQHPHTAHSVIETLVYFAPVDPVGILLLIGEVVKASSAQGYHYEQLLDVFVRVGWPRAHQLTYRLNEIYR